LSIDDDLCHSRGVESRLAAAWKEAAARPLQGRLVMSRTRGTLFRLMIGLVVGSVALTMTGSPKAGAAVSHEEVDREIRVGFWFVV
jgi:hypothetical protein